jgi:hypothetical protein
MGLYLTLADFHLPDLAPVWSRANMNDPFAVDIDVRVCEGAD